MRQSVFVLVFMLLMMMFVCLFMVQSLFVMERFAVIDTLHGQVEVQRPGQRQWLLAKEATMVQTKDTVRTASASEAELRWIDGTRVKLDQNTTMTIRKCTFNTLKKTENSQFHLGLGKIWVRIMRVLESSSKFEVMTPSATAAVRGTIFSVEVKKNGETDVTVYDGRVQVATKGTETFVEKGAAGRVTAEGQSPAIALQNPEELQSWQSQSTIVAPALQVTGPKDGAVTTEEFITVTGVTEPNAQLFLNAQSVPLRKDGEFRRTVALQEGANTLVVQVRDARGVETRRTLTVERTAQTAVPEASSPPAAETTPRSDAQ